MNFAAVFEFVTLVSPVDVVCFARGDIVASVAIVSLVVAVVEDDGNFGFDEFPSMSLKPLWVVSDFIFFLASGPTICSTVPVAEVLQSLRKFFSGSVGKLFFGDSGISNIV